MAEAVRDQQTVTDSGVSTVPLIEGVSFSQKDCLVLIEEMGVTVDSVRLSGGGARSDFWRQMLADIFERRVATLATQEGSAYGVALLAMVGTGAFHSVPEACKAAVKETASVNPRLQQAAAYRRSYEVFKVLYPTVKPLFGLM